MPNYIENIKTDDIKKWNVDLLQRLVKVKMAAMEQHHELIDGDEKHLNPLNVILKKPIPTAQMVDELLAYLNNMPKSFWGKFGLGLRSKLHAFLNGEIETTVYDACLNQHTIKKLESEIEKTQSERLTFERQLQEAQAALAALKTEKHESKGYRDFNPILKKYEHEISTLQTELEKSQELSKKQRLEIEKLRNEVITLQTNVGKLHERLGEMREEQRSQAKKQNVNDDLLAELKTKVGALEEKGSTSGACVIC